MIRQPRLSLAWRLLSLLLLVAAASCTEGAAPLAPGASGTLRLLMQPSPATANACAAVDPINRIRLTALAEPGGAVVHTEVFDVVPTDPNWTLRLEVPVEDGLTRIVVLMELINVSGGTERVQCSGMTAPITLDLSRPQQSAPVVIYDGPPDNLRVTGVDITTEVPASLPEGSELQLQVQVTGPGTPRAVWRSLDPEVASVDQAGLVRLLRDGTARIAAEAGVLSDMVTIVSTPRANSLRILESSLTAASLGDEPVFTAEVLDPRGAVIPGAAVQWTIDNAAFAQNLGNGRFRATANGTTSVRAAATGNPAAAATATLVVRQQPVTVSVQPATFVFTAIGGTTTFTAQARDARGNVIGDATFTWLSSAPGIVAITAAGVATAQARGPATITARSGSVEGTGSAQVTQLPARIALDPAGPLLLESLDATADVSARALDANDNPVSDVAPAWTSSDEGVATVDANGHVRAVGNGTATLTAAAAGVSASLQVTVRQRARRVVVTPATQQAGSLGDIVEFQAVVVDEGGSPLPDAGIVWSSEDEDIAESLGDGAFRARANGTAGITAASADDASLTGTGTLVVEQQAARVDVTPASFIFTAIGLAADFSAEAFDARGNRIAQPALTWSSTGPAVTVSPTGTATAAAAGTATVRATAPSGAFGSADVTVRQSIASLELSPAELRFTQVGASAPLGVTARDARGQVIVAPQGITWSASGSAATVDQAGLVTAVAPGNATVTATSGAVSASAPVVVEQAPASFRFAPTAPRLTRIGEIIDLEATALDAGGTPIPGAVPVLTSSDPSVVVVTGRTLTARAYGSATITATLGDVSGSVVVQVVRDPAMLAVSPRVVAVAPGASLALEARLLDFNGEVIEDAAITFASQDEDVATVDTDGVIRGVALGTTMVIVSGGGFTDEVQVTVGESGSGGQISGRVMHALTNQPIAGAVVTITPESFEGRRARADIAAAQPVLVTDSDGRYTSPMLPPGIYTVDVSAEGFISTTLHQVEVTDGDVEAVTVPLVPFSTQPGAISGYVVNAQTAGGLGGMTVELRSGVGATTGPPLATATTTGNGSYRFANLAAGTYSVRAFGPGFVAGTRTGISVGGSEIFNQNLPLIAQAVTEGEVRIVLSWGANPRDLDSHLTGPLPGGGTFHVAYYNRGSTTSSPFAYLDIDYTGGYGPETVTISQQFAGVYSYSVHHYSGSMSIPTSGAVVRVFRGNTQIAQFEPPSYVPPPGGSSIPYVWHVFDMNGTTITPVNSYPGGIPGMTTLGDAFRFPAKKR